MASGPVQSVVSFTMDVQPFTDLKEHMEEVAERATMYALRETGRKIIEVAAPSAPVYEQTVTKATDKRKSYTYVDSRVEPGLLRRSIHNAWNIKHSVEDYSLKVGVMGQVTGEKGHGKRGAVLYAKQEERKHGFMRRAIDAVDLGRIYNESLANGFRKFH